MLALLFESQKQLQSISISNFEMNNELLDVILQALPTAREFRMSNPTDITQPQIHSLLHKLADDCPLVQSLMFRGVNLSNPKCMRDICEIIEENRFLAVLDIANCQLQPP